MDEYTLPVDCVTSAKTHIHPLMVTITIQNTPVRMEVDTGATLSLMSYSTLSRLLPGAKLKPSAAKLRTYTGEEIKVKGVVEVKVKYGHQMKNLSLTVVDSDGPTLLGRDWLQHLKLDWATLNHVSQDERSELKSMLDTHSALFSEGLGQIKGTTAHLHLKEGSQPRFYRARQVPYALQDKVAKEIDRQIALGILEPANPGQPRSYLSSRRTALSGSVVTTESR